MPARILTFPAKYEQSDIDSHIRRYLAEVSTDAELINTVARRMKLFIDRYTSHTFRPVFDLAVPPGMTQRQTKALTQSIEKGVEAAAEQVERALCMIIVERLFIEVELYRLKKSTIREGTEQSDREKPMPDRRKRGALRKV